MPAIQTRADSLREYLTGAGSDGGSQTSPLASLGSYRSSTEASSYGIVVTNAIAGITVNYAAGGNTAGAGALTAVDANTLQWATAGGTGGPTVSIANGETKIVESSGAPGAYLRVSRTSSASLTGLATVTLTPLANDVFSFNDVSSANAAAGITQYLSTIIRNEAANSVVSFKRWIGTLVSSGTTTDAGQLGSSGAGTITTTGSFAGWPDSGWVNIQNGTSTREIVYYTQRTNTTLTIPSFGRGLLGTSAAAGSGGDIAWPVPPIAIAIDTNGVTSGGAAIASIANNTTAPSGVTWNTGITQTAGLSIGTLTAGQQVGIWIKRAIPPGAIATTGAAVVINSSFDAA